jgi:hypothetical protein
MRPMELLAHIDTDPDSGDTVYHRDLHFYGLATPVEDPADGSLQSEFSPISISGRSLLVRGRGAIPIEPSPAAEISKPSPAPLGVVQIMYLNNTNNSWEVLASSPAGA